MSRPFLLTSVVGAGGVTRIEGVAASCTVVGSSLSVAGTLEAFYESLLFSSSAEISVLEW